jgi:hypothetical protein
LGVICLSDVVGSISSCIVPVSCFGDRGDGCCRLLTASVD